VTVDLLLEDGDGLEAIGEAKFAGTVMLTSGMVGARRSAARCYARSLRINLQSLPKPIDLAALRICRVNLAKSAMGLPGDAHRGRRCKTVWQNCIGAEIIVPAARIRSCLSESEPIGA